MIYKALLLVLQKFLWSKIRGSIWSKLSFFVMTLAVALLLGGLFSSLYLNTSFLQGVWWAWEYMVSSFVKMDQLFSEVWDAWESR